MYTSMPMKLTVSQTCSLSTEGEDWLFYQEDSLQHELY